jgi:hypothetical protein
MFNPQKVWELGLEHHNHKLYQNVSINSSFFISPYKFSLQI